MHIFTCLLLNPVLEAPINVMLTPLSSTKMELTWDVSSRHNRGVSSPDNILSSIKPSLPPCTVIAGSSGMSI